MNKLRKLLLETKSSFFVDMRNKAWSKYESRQVKRLLIQLASNFPRGLFKSTLFYEVGMYSEVLNSMEKHGFLVKSTIVNSEKKKEDWYYMGPAGLAVVNGWRLEKLTNMLIILTTLLILLTVMMLV